MVHVSKPRSVNHSITEECGLPGTCKSKVGCDAIDEPCTKRMVPFVLSAGVLRQRNSLTSPLRVQCSVPCMEISRDIAGAIIERKFCARIGPPREVRRDAALKAEGEA